VHIFSREYRPEVDGLRAISVISVLLFHLDFHAFSGGFIGVDVFFVISGYLITKNIITDIGNGVFTFPRFYLKRLHRLFPAFLTTILITFLVSGLLLSPDHYERLAKSMIYTVLSVANVFFWSESGYFAAGADIKPFLHCWSLSVEEQFYLLWPLLVFFLAKLDIRKTVPKVVAIIMIISLIITEYTLKKDSEAAFFISFFRIYEFCIGALCIWLSGRDHNTKAAEILTFSGIGLILYSVFVFNGETPFPGVNALVPCVGAALVIAFSNKSIYAKAILKNKIMVLMGVLSYSLYLVHWPVIVLYKYWKWDSLSISDAVMLLVVCFVLAWLMHKYIEAPFRRANKEHNPLRFVVICLGCATTIIVIGAHVWGYNGFEWRVDERVNKIAEQINENPKSVLRGHEAATTVKDNGIIGVAKKKGEPYDVVVLGDSHAMSWVPGIDELLKEIGLSGLVLSRNGAISLYGAKNYNNKKLDVRGAREYIKAYAYIKKYKPKHVILAGRWGLQWNNTRPENEGKSKKYVVLKGGEPRTLKHTRFAFKKSLRNTIKFMKENGIKLTIIGGTPHLGNNPAGCLTRPMYLYNDVDKLKCQTLKMPAAMARIREVDALLKEQEVKYPKIVSYIDVAKHLCIEGNEYCSMFDGDTILYRDDDHLSVAGSKLIVRKYLREELASSLSK